LEGGGEKIKDSINYFREELLKMIDDTAKYRNLVSGLGNTLNTDDVPGQEGDMKTWEIANFSGVPMAGASAMLSKMQADARNAEADMLGYLYSMIDAGSFKFNKIEAIVKSPSNYVLRGQPFEAEIFIAASDSTEEPEIYVGNNKLTTIKDGKGIYRAGTDAVGPRSISGKIVMKHPSTGEELSFPFKSEYQVGEPSVSVSLDKMNVFYVGVPNPVSVTASGVPDDKVRVGISGGGGMMQKSGKGYAVMVKKPGETATITVSADIGGSVKTLGSFKYRVKSVPDPVAKIGKGKNARGGDISKNELVALGRVYADLENFDFDLEFKVTEFMVSTVKGGYVVEEKQTRGGNFTSQQKELIGGLRPGSKIYFEEIKAKGPDGTLRSLGNIGFKLN
jgi:gliding motility-associated protein GldM